MAHRNRSKLRRERRRWLAAAMLVTIACAGCGHKRKARNTPAAPQPGRQTTTARRPAAPAPVGSVEEGLASWYGPPYHGRMAADGEIYDMEKLTAAHRTLPFQTWVHVTNLANGLAVDVRITDRGPFVEGRIIDLSKAAARRIELLGPGVGAVRLEVIPAPSGDVGAPAAVASNGRAPASPSANASANKPALAEAAGIDARRNDLPAASEASAGTSAAAGDAELPAAEARRPALLVTQQVAAATADTIGGRNLYAVQAGVFTVYENASRLRDVCTKTYAPSQLAIRQGARPAWRVLVGSFESEAEAQQLAQKIRAERKEAVFVVHLDPPPPNAGTTATPQPGAAREVAPPLSANPRM